MNEFLVNLTRIPPHQDDSDLSRRITIVPCSSENHLVGLEICILHGMQIEKRKKSRYVE